MKRRALLLLFLAAVARADEPAGPQIDATAQSFAHIEHSGRVVASGKPAQPCASCHDMKDDGRWRSQPNHQSCFASCHSGADVSAIPAAGSAEALLCTACHPDSALDAARGARHPRPAVRLPADSLDKDFALQLSHRSHAEVKGDCRACHALPGTGQVVPKGHALCGQCHSATGTTPTLSQCEVCHQEAVGPLRAPVSEAGSYPVGTAFSHKKHQKHGARSCRPCHAEAAAAADEWIPTPKKGSCGGCHDGTTAFSMIESACRRCHQKPEKALTSAAPKFRGAAFSHQSHRAAGESRPCSTCHGLGKSGQVRALSDHLSCAGGGCHQSDFSATDSNLCGVCHVGNEPWRGLHVDRMRVGDSEFEARFSHSAHAGELKERACESCHQGRPSGELGLIRNHASCASPDCHSRDGKAGPSIEACESCHQRDDGTEVISRWSVRDKFSHQNHLSTQEGEATSCASCHAGVWDGPLESPAKRACMACHDGDKAFKVTGHQCARCHTATEVRR